MSPTTGHQIPAPPAPRTRKRKSPPQPRSGVISARQPVPAEASRPVPAVPAPKPAPKRIRKRKSPPQPRSGILAQAQAPAPAVEASRPSKAAPEASEPAPARPMASRITVAALASKIQALEAQIMVQDVVAQRCARQINDLEAHMAETIVGYEARIDSLEIKLAGAQRTIDELTAAGEVARVTSRPVPGTIPGPVLVQAKLEPKSTKEPAVPAAAKSYANHLIWAAVIIASLLIWAVASRSGDDAPVPAPVAAAAETTWVYDVPVPKMQPDTMVRRKLGRMLDVGKRIGYDSGWHAGVKHVRDSLSRLPKPRKATLADFETDAERARRLDSLARVQKLHDEGF